jgi:hypothetical protein
VDTQQIGLQPGHEKALEIKPRAVTSEGTEGHTRPDMARVMTIGKLAGP